MNNNFKISIITVCRNSALTIEKTIKSVINQTYKNIEYIIIDGASEDDTINIVNKYKNFMSKFISEPDGGIYNAMNKGISLAEGDYILFINADDILASEKSIQSIVENISSTIYTEYDIVYGNVIINSQNNFSHVWKGKRISKFSIFRGSIPHEATFYKKDVFNKCGDFDENYKIAGDYEWFIRAIVKFNLKFYYVNQIVAEFNKGGISTNKEYSQKLKFENESAKRKYYTNLEIKYYNFRWFLKKI